MRVSRLLLAGLIVLTALGATAAQDKDKSQDNLTRLQGIWQVVKASDPQDMGAALTFSRDGKFTYFKKTGDRELLREGTYSILNDQVTVTWKAGARDEKTVYTISKLLPLNLTLEWDGKMVDLKKRR